MPDERVRGQKPQESGAPAAERRYRSPTIGEIFRRAGGIEVPEAMKEAARKVEGGKSGVWALTMVFEGLDPATGWRYNGLDPATYNVDEVYNEVINSLKGASYILEDIQPFINFNADALKSNENSGVIISAMINNIIKEGDKVEFDSSGLLLKYVGYKLPCGALTINGSAGYSAGDSMSGGTLTINGNAGGGTGHSMSGGILTINGNVGNWPGHLMSSGTLTINGNAGNQAGHGMRGGTLTINGNAGEAAGYRMSGGILTIHGNAGIEAGDSMSGGILTIHGNASDRAGYCMRGGTLTIKGDAGNFVGLYTNQSTGTIVIEGWAKSLAKSRDRGGKLFAN